MMRLACVILLGLLAFWTETESYPQYALRTTDLSQSFPAQKRAVSPDGEEGITSTAEEVPSQQVPPKPMNPFLSIRPFLPVKPTFMPPFVDPNIFIDKKTAFLNSLFSSIPNVVPTNDATAPKSAIEYPTVAPNYFVSKKAQFLNPLFSNLAAQSSAPAGYQTVKRDLNETDEVPEQSPSSPTPAVGSSIYTDKKAGFLHKLFKILNLNAVNDTTEDSPVTSKPTIVPPNFWGPVTAEDTSVTPKPTIVPPNFWSPFGSSSDSTLPRVPLTKTTLISDPNIFIDKKTKFLNTLFSNFAVSPKSAGVVATKAPIVPANYWVPSGKPVPSTIYDQKVSEFLDKLFKSLNISSNPATVNKRDIDSLLSKNEAVSDETVENHSGSYQRRFIGPSIGVWGPPSFVPILSPKVFIDKKTEFLNKLFTSLNTPAPSETLTPEVDEVPSENSAIAPPNPWSSFDDSDPIDSPTTVKPTIVPPNFWFPYAATSKGEAVNVVSSSSDVKPGPVIDPSVFINKKAQFLDNLFNNLYIPSTPVPATEAPITTSDENDTDVSVLSDLLSGILQSDTVSKRNNVHRENVDDISSEEVFDADLSKRTLDTSINPENPFLQAKDKIVSSIITELAGIKDEMMSTVDEIVKQKNEATVEETSLSPFAQFGAKGPYGFSGGKMFGASKKGASKKGETAGALGKKKTSSPFGSKFSFLPPKPTSDPTLPLQERLNFLSQVFEMLTKLQQNVTSAINLAAKESTVTTPAPVSDEDDFLNLLQKVVQTQSSTDPPKTKFISSKYSREIQSNPDSSPSLHNNLIPSSVVKKNEETGKTRSIKMAVHQGYQSLPPGTEEIIETGGGSETDEHEGGGLKLQDYEYDGIFQDQPRHHHHNHH